MSFIKTANSGLIFLQKEINMRTLELNNGALYLDGNKLRGLTEFSIDFEIRQDDGYRYCWLKAKGVVLHGSEIVYDGYGDFARYEIDEEVKLKDSRERLYNFEKQQS